GQCGWPVTCPCSAVPADRTASNWFKRRSVVMGASWFAVRSQVHAEEKAAWHLGNQGFKAYLPRYRRRIRHARRNVTALRPLFPGYLFVNLDPEVCRWRAVNGTIGVREILTNGDVPLVVPKAIIAEIMSREDETGAVRVAPPSFARGQIVRLL